MTKEETKELEEALTQIEVGNYYNNMMVHWLRLALILVIKQLLKNNAPR